MHAPHPFNNNSSFRCLKVLWVILAIANGVDNSPVGSHSSIEGPFPPAASVDRAVYYRLKRSPDEEAFPAPYSSEIPDEINSQLEDDTQINSQYESSESSTSREIEKESDPLEEQTKSKQNSKQQKYIPSFFKNFNSNKVNTETRILATNESLNDKQKPTMYSPQGYGLKQNGPNKKETKLNTSYSDYILKGDTANLNIPSRYSGLNKKAKVEADVGGEAKNITKAVKPNTTLAMSDQPAEEGSETPHNVTVTDLSDDESLDVLSSNITDTFGDISNTTSADGRTMPASEGLDILMISGITVGTVVLLALMAGGGFVVYRHRMWNKPQTLSDKCSNADSSGYIDDSTLRENSEEMYSLDNDSFLNSLEAMTIQNYWTDNVKHTKL
ncbi:uncharacterized protein LOC124362240 isoform X1 [Homalodisca vitripennis]|uniref:uncharacterized protein LOC124362240 isoform X1 n=1 Tax=Homalodisca vitripennis TaxID=197043 RepID=UPI001EEBC605|nr:uncharacterized protein LOC124362240 isoform X1 [Homalodisca vitripennis]